MLQTFFVIAAMMFQGLLTVGEISNAVPDNSLLLEVFRCSPIQPREYCKRTQF